MHLLYGIKPNIVFVVAPLSRQNADSYINHLKAIKRVIYYLKDTMYLRLTYGFLFWSTEQTKASVSISIKPYGLIRYADSNNANDLKDQKSVMRYYFYLNGTVVF